MDVVRYVHTLMAFFRRIIIDTAIVSTKKQRYLDKTAESQPRLTHKTEQDGTKGSELQLQGNICPDMANFYT